MSSNKQYVERTYINMYVLSDFMDNLSYDKRVKKEELIEENRIVKI